MKQVSKGQTAQQSPRATCRIQFSKDFRLADAREIVPYLAALGISHIYASPLLMARPGSAHGYDIVDHNRVNPEIGDATALDTLVADLRAHGMGLIIDFVPNHMGIGPDNPWWIDVLEWGAQSPYASYFDIDWEPLEPTNAGKIVLPFLGDHYGQVLERGELTLRLDRERGSFSVGYFDNVFPISPQDYPSLLQRVGADVPEVQTRLAPLIASFRDALASTSGRRHWALRRERIGGLRDDLVRLLAVDESLVRAISRRLDEMNGRSGEPFSFDALHRLLDRQAYRLAYWRVAAHEINYRRFFDINDLAGLRMEQPALFEVSHRLVRRWIDEGKIEGIRIDHIDGLRDPKSYLERLQTLAEPAWQAARPRPRVVRERASTSPPLYVVVEKILASHERLREGWPVAGTTGYDFLALVNGLFVDPRGQSALTRAYERFIDRHVDLEDMGPEAKRLIMRETLASELNVLANSFNRLAKQSRRTRDYTITGFREALEDVAAHFPVYRTYGMVNGVTAEDRRDIDWAIGKARKTARSPDTSIYDFIRDVLTLDLLRSDRRSYRRRDIVDLALRFQQYTAPVMAKAMEDTAFYRYFRLVSLNEVGNELGRFAITPHTFHEANRQRQKDWPLSMLATATHDHKRGEDVRARLNVLSEIPAEWSRRVRRWANFNARKKREVDGRHAPRRNDEYLFYQTILGAWPYGMSGPAFEGLGEFAERIGAYMRKAVREAKMSTSWAAPDVEYESAVQYFVERVLDPNLSRPFLDDLCEFVGQIAPVGATNALAQVLLKLTSPGVPDIYQGTEWWDLSLVDPDNRRPVAYAARAQAMRVEENAPEPLERLMDSWRDGRVKQAVIRRALDLRRRHPDLFTKGEYHVLEVTGLHADKVVAFARIWNGETAVAAVPRLVSSLTPGNGLPLPVGWDDTRVVVAEAGSTSTSFRDCLSGREITLDSGGTLTVAALFSALPGALLFRAGEAGR